MATKEQLLEDLLDLYKVRIASLEQLAGEAATLLAKCRRTIGATPSPLQTPLLSMIDEWQEAYEEKVEQE